MDTRGSNMEVVTFLPFSPSLRGKETNPKHRPLRVAAALEQLNELPLLLVNASVGCHSLLPSLIIYRQLNKEFAKAVLEAISEWCKDYSALKDAHLDAWVNQESSQYFATDMHMRIKFEAAFGKGAIQSTGRCISTYNAHVYWSIALGRCSICNEEINSGDVAPSKVPPTYTYSHTLCERRRCHRMKTEHMLNSNLCPNAVINFNEREVSYSTRAVIWYKQPFPDLATLMKRMSPMAQYVNRVSYRNTLDSLDPQHLSFCWWLRSCSLVEPEDSLFSMCGIGSEQEVILAYRHANEMREDVRRLAAMHRCHKERTEKQATRQREAAIRLQLAMAKLPWTTPNAIMAFSPRALDATGYNAYVQDNTSNVLTVIRRIAFMHDVLAVTNVSQLTVDFMLGPSNSQECIFPIPRSKTNTPYWEAEVEAVRRVVRSVDVFGKNNFALKLSEASQAARHVVADASTTPLLTVLTKYTTVLVKTRFDWTVGQSETASTIHLKDETLYRMRAATGLTDVVDLDAALCKGAHLSLYEDAAKEILSKALNTELRGEVLSALKLYRLVENVLFDVMMNN